MPVTLNDQVQSVYNNTAISNPYITLKNVLRGIRNGTDIDLFGPGSEYGPDPLDPSETIVIVSRPAVDAYRNAVLGTVGEGVDAYDIGADAQVNDFLTIIDNHWDQFWNRIYGADYQSMPGTLKAADEMTNEVRERSGLSLIPPNDPNSYYIKGTSTWSDDAGFYQDWVARVLGIQNPTLDITTQTGVSGATNILLNAEANIRTIKNEFKAKAYQERGNWVPYEEGRNEPWVLGTYEFAIKYLVAAGFTVPLADNLLKLEGENPEEYDPRIQEVGLRFAANMPR